MRHYFLISLFFFFVSCLSGQTIAEFIITDVTGKTHTVPTSKVLKAHYCTSIFGTYYNFPKRFFSTKYEVTEVPSIKDIYLEIGLDSKARPFMSSYEEVELGMPFFNDGYKQYDSGIALVESDEDISHIIKSLSSKPKGDGHIITSKASFAATKIYGYCFSGSCCYFKVKQ